MCSSDLVEGFYLTEKTVYAKSLPKREEAYKAMGNENYQYARTLLKQLLTLGNVDEEIVYALAITNSELGNHDEAIDGFTSVINYNRSPLAYALRGLCKYASGKDGWESDLRLGGSDGVDLLRKINEEATNKQQKNSSPPQRSYLQNSGSKSLRDYL